MNNTDATCPLNSGCATWTGSGVTGVKKSLYGSNLDEPQSLDTTRLKKDEPGGEVRRILQPTALAPRKPTSANIKDAPLQPPLSYAEVARKGHAGKAPLVSLVPQRVVNTSVRNHSPADEGLWMLARHGKKARGSRQTSSRRGDAAERTATTKAVPIKVASTGGAPRNWRLTANKQAANQPVRQASGRGTERCHPTPTEPPVRYDEKFYSFLAQVSREDHRTWMQFLGSNGQKGKLKVEKLKKAFKAIGLESKRKAKGSHFTFTPTWFADGALPITLHLPHGANLEDIEMRNKAGSVRDAYPLAVNAFERYWRITNFS